MKTLSELKIIDVQNYNIDVNAHILTFIQFGYVRSQLYEWLFFVNKR